MKVFHNLRNFAKGLCIIVTTGTIVLSLLIPNVLATDEAKEDSTNWMIYFRPGVRFGTDHRTLYVMDFLVPLYQGDKNILFANPKYTPNDQDGWEVNLGLGYRHMLFNDSVILGINGFYDKRKTPWGSIHEQWGIGAEAMAEVPIGKTYLGLTGRFNYYQPITSPKISVVGGGGDGFIFKGNGIYAAGGIDDGTIEEPLRGIDAEIGVRVPYISNYIETWVYGGGYHFDSKYFKDINGVSARLEVIPTDFLRLNYEYRQDRTNSHKGGDHYGEVMFEVPFSIDNLVAGKNPFEGLGKRLGGSRALNERLVEPVRRDVDVVVYRITGDHAKALLQALGYGTSGSSEVLKELIFVSGSGDDDTGNGTYEKPYKSIGRAFRDNKVRFGSVNIIQVLDAGPGLKVIGDRRVIEHDDEHKIDYYVHYMANVENVTVWGAGAVYEGFSNIRNYVFLDFPEIGNALTVVAPNIAIRGLSFNIEEGSDLNNVGIILKEGSGVTIEGNKFSINVNSVGPLSRNVSGISTYENFVDVVGGYLDYDMSFMNAQMPLTIKDNEFVVKNEDSCASGINLHIENEGFISITDNFFDITGKNDTYGIRLEHSNKFLGLGILPDLTFDAGSFGTEIVHNDFNVVSTEYYGNAYGISCNGTKSTITARIIDNDLKVDAGNEAYGVYLKSDKVLTYGHVPIKYIKNELLNWVIGKEVDAALGEVLAACLPEDYPLYSFSYLNTFDVISRCDDSYGIYSSTDDSQLSVIRTNDMFFKTSNEGGIRAADASYGVFLDSTYYNVNTYIQNNQIYTYSVDGESKGIYCEAQGKIDAHIGSWEAIPIDPNSDFNVNNIIKVTSENSDAFGINLESYFGDILGEITNNSMTGEIFGNKSATGILLIGENIGYGVTGSGSPVIDPFIIKDNQIKARKEGTKWSNKGDGVAGIVLESTDSLFTEITNNDMSWGLYSRSQDPESSSYGISLSSAKYLGSASNPALITNNIINITKSGGNSSGISVISGTLGYTISPTIFARVNDNKVSIANGGNGIGISIGVDNPYLSNYHAYIGSESSPLEISNNILSISKHNSSAIGISVFTEHMKYSHLFASIINNRMVPEEYDFFNGTGISANNVATGISLYLGRKPKDGLYGGYDPDRETIGNFGSKTAPLIIQDNYMTVTSLGVYASGILALAIGYGHPESFFFIKSNHLTEATGITGERGAFGISIGTRLGSIDKPVLLLDNELKVSSKRGNAVGIGLTSDSPIYAEITRSDDNSPGNTITVIGETTAAGINLDERMGYGPTSPAHDSSRPIEISHNIINVDSEYDYARGIYYIGASPSPNANSYLNITNNELRISKGILDINADGSIVTKVNSMFFQPDHIDFHSDHTVGIFLYNGRNYGDSNHPITITGNTIEVTAVDSPAIGAVLYTSGNVFSKISDNPSIVLFSPEAVAFLIAGKLIGDWTISKPTVISGNDGAIHAQYPVLLFLCDNNSWTSRPSSNHYINLGYGSSGSGSNDLTADSDFIGHYGLNNEVFLGETYFHFDKSFHRFVGHIVP